MHQVRQFWKSEEGKKFLTEYREEKEKVKNKKLKKLNQKAAKIGARVVMKAKEEILLEEQERLPGNDVEIVLQEQANAALGEEEERKAILQDNQTEEEREATSPPSHKLPVLKKFEDLKLKIKH